MTNITIPSFTLNRQNDLLQEDLLKCITKVLNKGVFILHENVTEIEENMANYCQSSYGIGVSSGSDALYLSLLACGIGPGDEVITTPFTFFATASSISRTGAKPVFVDIDPKTLNINSNLIRHKINSNTRAILPVHLFGCPADMRPITDIAGEYNLFVIEDAAQAIGAKYQDKKIGSFGDAACFSFFPTKNLGALGDGGMIVTNNHSISEQIKLLRLHGAKKKYHHEIFGFNSRLDELQAAILNIKFNFIELWNSRRREIAHLYNSLFEKLIDIDKMGIRLPIESKDTYHVYHQYTIQTNKRDELQTHLKKQGIASTVYYPVPLHLQKVYSSLGYGPGSLPVSELACNQVLSLPMFPELTNDEIKTIVESIADFFYN